MLATIATHPVIPRASSRKTCKKADPGFSVRPHPYLVRPEHPQSIITEEEMDLLASKLRTPLQIQLHRSLSLKAGYLTGEKPVSSELIESVLSRQRYDLEPNLSDATNVGEADSCRFIRHSPGSRAR